jgi:Relaxase/Mobilisation nuclease domain
MNWAKGRSTKGRGTSFKGALVYVLHDKDAQTSERVGFVEIHNLATDDPHRAWREMKALCDAANDLKKRSGVKATGRKLTRPVYAFTLNWHEADNPDAAHMRETAFDALRTLGMENHQAVIVEHTDRPHKHVHVIVNLVDPETGLLVSLSNDDHKLDRWADDYEVSQGVISSPDRRAKFHALDNGVEPPKRPPQAKSREEWLATRTLNGEKAKQRAAEIKAAYAAHVANLKTAQTSAFKARTAQAEKLWNSYTADRKAVNDRYQPFIDAIWKSKRKSPRRTRYFAHNELSRLTQDALRIAPGPLTTAEIAGAVMQAKGMPPGDAAFKEIAERALTVLRRLAKRGTVVKRGTSRTAQWALMPTLVLDNNC